MSIRSGELDHEQQRKRKMRDAQQPHPLADQYFQT
jgi:hypothetical protein